MADEIKTTSRKPRRVLRWIGIIFGALLLLLVVAYFVVTSEWALKSVILPKVSKAANAQVTVENASISPFSSVRLRELKVQTTGTEPLVTAQEVRLRYSLMDIIRGKINVSEVALESPVVNLVTFPDGTSNLDPITKQPKEAKPKGAPKEKKPEKPPELNVQKLALNNATVRVVEQHKDGTRKVTELTGVTVTADDIGNNKTGQLGLAANVKMDQGSNTSSNGVLAATVGGKFNLVLDAALKPQTVKGQTKVDVTEAKGAFAQATGLGVVLNADLTPTQLNDVSVRLAQSGKNLGAVTVNGPFNAETMEGKLAANISQIDRQALNLAGAAMGIDFNQTAISSTNTIELTQRGRMIAVNGALVVGNFSATQKGQTTPVLDVRSAYSVTYDQAKQTALLQAFALNGTQNNAEFLRGTLAKPMLVNLGKGAEAMDDSALDLVLTGFNLPDWRPFIPTNVNLVSGQVGANLKLLSRQGGKDLSVTGRAAVNDLTASIQSNRFDRFATTVDVDVGMRGSALDIRKVVGSLQQSGQPGGGVDVTGNYDLSNKTGLITAKITDLNQNALKSFLAAALGDKQLESVTISANTTAKLDGPTDMSVKAEVHVANLVVNDPSGQVPKTPLGLDAIADVSNANNVIDLRQVQLALAKTERAPNSLNVAGRIDMSKSNAWTGNLKVTSEGLDVTPYYDLFAGNRSKQTNAVATPQPAPQQPTQSKPETEPQPMKLPFTQFTEEVNIAKFFLREIAISNLVSKTTIENGRVNVNPFTLTLNGAPVSLTALANVSVPGYEYDLNATLDRVPVEPLANTFAPAQRGIYKGEIVSNIKLKGAGLTGPNIKRNLGGAIGFVLTNAEVKISDARFENRYLGWLVKWAPLVGRYLQVPEMADSPVSLVDAQVGITNGNVHLRRAFVESPAFQANVPGTITLNEVMTNSALNKLPLQLALRRSVAEKARLAAPGSGDSHFVELPSFVSIEGTVGKPKYDLNERAVLQLIAKAAGGFIKGDAGNLLRNLGNLGTGGTTTGTNSPGTNATQNLLRNLGGLLNKPAATNTATTNAPAQKKGGFNLNNLLK